MIDAKEANRQTQERRQVLYHEERARQDAADVAKAEALIAETIAKGHDSVVYPGAMWQGLWDSLHARGYNLTVESQGILIDWSRAE